MDFGSLFRQVGDSRVSLRTNGRSDGHELKRKIVELAMSYRMV